MIAKALSFIAGFLNKEIKLTYGISDDKVVVSSLINPDGTITENIENKLIISVINLEHETTVKSMNNYFSGNGNKYGKMSPPVCLNLFLLVSANYNSGNYMEGLKMLSTLIGIFQANNHFDQNQYPDMEAPLEKLTFEIFNIPINELSHIWSGIGAKYVPSIIYKVRMITIQETVIQQEVAGVSGLAGEPKAENQ